MHSPSRIIGFGTAMVDAIAAIPDDFLYTIPGDKGGTVKITEDQMRDILQRLPEMPARIPGGATANTLAGIAHLLGKGTAALFALTGNDENAKFYMDFMKGEGIDTSRCMSTSLAPTGVCLSLITPDAERTMRSFTGANDLVTPETFPVSVFDGYHHFFIEGYAFRNTGLGDYLIETADCKGLVVGIDFNAQEIVRENRERFRRLLKEHVTVAFANEQEAMAFAETDNPEDALQALSECCPIAIVKLGERGSLIKEKGREVLRIPAVTATAIDTTGAGDLWAAGFYAGWLSGHSLEFSGMLAAHVASEIVKVIGAHLPDATWSRLQQKMISLSK
ncbi:MAG: adenosine kinase [Victivallales bacterium]|nr:adenosine kinase [Victivallales bacterium]